MRRLVLPLLLLAAAAGCGGKTVQPTIPADRIVLAAPRPPAGPPMQPPDWFETEITLVEEELQGGRLADALRRVYHAREQSPGEPFAAQLRQLLAALNHRVLELDTISGRVAAEKDPIVFGEPLRVRVILGNAGARDLRIPARARGRSQSLLIFEVQRQEFDTRAQVVTTRRRVHHRIARDLVIPAGGTTERIVSLGLSGNDRPLAGFRVYTVGAVLRPGVVEVGELRRWEATRLEPAAVRSFRSGYEHLADNPIKRIGQAIEKRAGVHLLTASALVAPEKRQAAVDRLVGALQGDRAIDWAIFASLQHLTEMELGRAAAAWRAWWPRVRETYFDAPPKRRPPDVPVFD